MAALRALCFCVLTLLLCGLPFVIAAAAWYWVWRVLVGG